MTRPLELLGRQRKHAAFIKFTIRQSRTGGHWLHWLFTTSTAAVRLASSRTKISTSLDGGVRLALWVGPCVSGLISPEQDRLELFEKAVEVLKESPAYLEYAKALVDLGAALRKAGHRNDARPPLRHALDLATRCGAVTLADRASAELVTAGARRRRTALTGPGALTPSERRVADLAANGQTNRQIAQTLFVTPKTVEVHLSNCYRKLSVTSRVQLPGALAVS